MGTYKKQKNRYQLCLFLLNNIVDLKKKLSKILFQFDLDIQYHEIVYDTVMKKTLPPRFPPFER